VVEVGSVRQDRSGERRLAVLPTGLPIPLPLHRIVPTAQLAGLVRILTTFLLGGFSPHSLLVDDELGELVQ